MRFYHAKSVSLAIQKEKQKNPLKRTFTICRSTVQASKQSTKVMGPPPSNNTNNAWNSKSSKPLNNWTTLKSSKTNSTCNNNNNDTSNGTGLKPSQSDTGLSDRPTAWGSSTQTMTSSQSSSAFPTFGAAVAAPWGESRLRLNSDDNSKKESSGGNKKKEPVIDYFEMTD